MGQQQLLLVILVTIIVGIATVVAINTFGSAANTANVDAVRNDMAQIAASAQSHFMKPAMMEGGGNTFSGLTFNDISFGADSLSNSDLTAHNPNGDYTIAPSADSFTITAVPGQADGEIAAYVEADCMEMSDYAETGSATAPSACS